MSSKYLQSVLKVGDKYRCISEPRIVIEVFEIFTEDNPFMDYLFEAIGYRDGKRMLTHWYVDEVEFKYDYKKI